MAGTKKKLGNAVRRAVCLHYGATPGTTIEVPCAADCGRTGVIRWQHNYRYWPIVSGLEFDHIIPAAAGGSHEADNIQMLCQPCNRRKGSHV